MNRNKTLLTLTILAALGAGSAFAATQSSADPDTRPARASLDVNGDGVIDRTEAAAHPRLAEHFDTLDKNKDGKLNANERPQHKGGRHGRGPRGEGMARFRQLDKDGDGRISQAEAAAEPKFQQRFADMDANKDGFVDRADRELRGKQRRDQWFAQADTDKDGKLSRAEYDQAAAKRGEDFRRKFDARGDGKRATDVKPQTQQ
ncbi:EF-hand domain-containing protein [Pseudoxanthomonas indica]|uniref:EF hand n=1 Tax=Pseudoxanthomonas indica TaxID=428993 RepID=A0A1T5LQY3_9GAMM|nr:calcium-binding protein [Pseudoxanthomonas indica]GGD38450.1 hypothetical protein GCM10007235_08220 [Pseudoxanthomonas indica]SKC78396.1 EF hand [Pseudoxanthomonas indica]